MPVFNFNFNNFKIELIMHYPCRSKQELIQKEGYFIRLMRPLCNTIVPGNHPANGLVIKAPTKRDIQKQMIAIPRVYSEIEEIGAEQAKFIHAQMHLNKASCTQILQFQKYWFDTKRVQHFDDTETDRGFVFGAIGDKKSRYLFENFFAFRTQSSAETLRELNPFEDLSQSASARSEIACSLKRLCQVLQIESVFQNSIRIPQARLITHQRTIDNEINLLLALMPKVKTTSKSTDAIKLRQMRLNNILSEWSRSTFQQDRHGNHKNGQKEKIDYLVKASNNTLQHMSQLI